MQTLEELIAAAPLFAGPVATAHLELIAGCGANEHFAAGAQLFHEGAQADRFFLIREGSVALEVEAPGPRHGSSSRRSSRARSWAGRGCSSPTAGSSTRRAREPTRVVAFDGACLRGKCEADHELGYQLMRRFAASHHRAPAGDAAAAARRLRPCSTSPETAAPGARPDGAGAVRGRGQAAGDRRHVDARARAARRASGCAFAPGQFTMLSAFGSGEVPISISGDPGGEGPLVHTVRAVGLATQAICDAASGDVLGVRGPFGRPWPVAELAGADVLVVAGGIGLAPLRPRSSRCSPAASATGASCCSTADARPISCCSPTSWRSGSARGLEVAVTVDSAGPEWLGHVGVVPRLVRRAEFDPAGAVALLCGPEVMMRFTVAALAQSGVGRRSRVRIDGAQHAVRDRALRSLPARAHARLPRRAGLRVERARALAGDPGAVMAAPASRRSPCGSSPPATAAS